jgi:hypothetical protein
MNISYTPSYMDQSNFAGWNFGRSFPNWWPDVQFPINDSAAWERATSSRYQEWDTIDNVQLQSDAAAVAADSNQLGNNIVYLTNSAGGLRALMTAVKANGTNIKGIVAYECMGSLFPDNVGITAGRGGFGPFVVQEDMFKKLANLTSIQFVWGDHRPESDNSVRQTRKMAELIVQYGGNARVLKLNEDGGLTGNTHIPFADMNNAKVAHVLDQFLADSGLDDYA